MSRELENCLVWGTPHTHIHILGGQRIGVSVEREAPVFPFKHQLNMFKIETIPPNPLNPPIFLILDTSIYPENLKIFLLPHPNIQLSLVY